MKTRLIRRTKRPRCWRFNPSTREDVGTRCTYLDGTTGVKCVGDGPVDVWLADNNWFGLNVYCAVVANEGYNNEGAFLISQQRHKSDSDIRQSGR